MPRVEIRVALSPDIPALVGLDHTSETQRVWRLNWEESDGLGASFRPVPLPRPLKLVYPRPVKRLLDDWQRRGVVLAAIHDGAAIGYLIGETRWVLDTLWVTDLVVDKPWRRQGVATALLLTAEEWAVGEGLQQIVLEMSFRNDPAVTLAQHLGFNFSGFLYGYYPQGDTALFFAAPLT